MIKSPSLIVLAAIGLALAACGGSRDQGFQGWVEADLVFVGPDEPGRVATLAVREGNAVTTGAPLFAVDADLQESDVSANQAVMAEARARLDRAEAQQQRPAEVAVLEAQQERAEAAFALSTQELQRQKALSEKGFSPQAQLDTAQGNFNRDKAALEEIRRQIKVARMAARDEDIAAARQSFAAASARLKSAETRLARRKVASPVSGSVQQVYFRPGETVPAGRPVVALLPPGNIKVRFFVPEPLVPKVTVGATVQVQCDGCEGALPARVDFISRAAEYTPPVAFTPEERAKLVFLVEARPAEPEKLRVGQPVRVLYPAGEQGK